MCTLLDIPDLVMRNILKDCDFVSILKVRKVCHALREFIDCSSLIQPLERITVGLYLDVVEVYMNWDTYAYPIKYWKIGKGNETYIQFKNKKIRFKNSDFMKIFFNDFDGMLRVNGSKKVEIRMCPWSGSHSPMIEKEEEKKSCWSTIKKKISKIWRGSPKKEEEEAKETSLDVLIPMISNNLSSFLDFLKDKPKLRVKYFEMDIYSADHLMGMLQCIDSTVLKELKADNKNFDEWIKVDMSQIMKLIEWENIQRFEIVHCMTSIAIRQLLHIPIFDVTVKKLSDDDVLDLAVTLSRAPDFPNYIVRVPYHIDLDWVASFLDPPACGRNWHYRIEGDEEMINRVGVLPSFLGMQFKRTDKKYYLRPENHSYFR